MVALLLVVAGVTLLLAAAGSTQSLVTGGLIGLGGSAEGRAVVGLVGAASILAAIGMALRLPVAWGLAMFVIGLGLAAQLVTYARGDFNLVRLGLYVVMAFYLNQRAVREVFLPPRATVA